MISGDFKSNLSRDFQGFSKHTYLLEGWELKTDFSFYIFSDDWQTGLKWHCFFLPVWTQGQVSLQLEKWTQSSPLRCTCWVNLGNSSPLTSLSHKKMNIVMFTVWSTDEILSTAYCKYSIKDNQKNSCHKLLRYMWTALWNLASMMQK